MILSINPKFGILSDKNYRIFLFGYFVSFVAYWLALLAVGYWIWEETHSALWVSFVYFCDLIPGVIITPLASAYADRGNRFTILKTVLLLQAVLGFALALTTWFGFLNPLVLAGFILVDGALVGVSQPAFFGLINRIVSKKNLAAAVGLNSSVIQITYVIGPIFAGILFSFGSWTIPYAFVGNAICILVYVLCLNRIELRPAKPQSDGLQQGETYLASARKGLSIFWSQALAFQVLTMTVCISFVHRPLTSLMPGINDFFDIFRPAYFTFLIASFMGGGIVASIIHASRNTDRNLEYYTVIAAFGSVSLILVIFTVMNVIAAHSTIVLMALFLLGLFSNFVGIGNSILLQGRTPEHLRSRVLGNSHMISRVSGAISVIIVGLSVDNFGFIFSFQLMSILLLIAIFLLWYFVYRRFYL